MDERKPMFKWWPLMWKIRHESEIWQLQNKLQSYSMEVHAYKDKVNAELKEFLWQHGHFKAERALREAYIAHLESLVNEMQENQR